MDIEGDPSWSTRDDAARLQRRPEHGASPDATTRAEPPIAPIVFINHEGKRFVFPFESCRTWETFKVLLEQTYRLAKDKYKRAIEKGLYDLLTSDDEVILPAVWETIVGSHLRSVQESDTVRHNIKLLFRWQKASGSESEASDDGSESRSRALAITRSSYDYGRRRSRSSSSSNSRSRRRARRPSNTYGDEDVRPRPRSGSQSRSRSRARARSNSRSRSRTRARVVPPEFDFFRDERPRRRSRSSEAPGPPPVTRRDQVQFDEPMVITRESSEYMSDAASSSVWSEGSRHSEGGSEDEAPAPLAQKPIKADPTDTDGNKLLLFVDTRRAAPKKRLGGESQETNKTVKTSNMSTESLRILKAVQTASENRMAISVHTLQGPESPSNSSGINIRWHHLHAEHLDFAQFKSACLATLGLSDRQKVLITQVLERIEKEKLKASLDGMFIDPGTVLRGEEKDREDPLSVIFSCVPYFDVKVPTKSTFGKGNRLEHSSRTLMQSYYPYEPVQERDMDQAFRKFKSGQPDQIIHVPSLWIMNISAHAIVTCGHYPLSTDFVKSIFVVKEDPAASEEDKLDSAQTVSSRWPTIRVSDKDGRNLIYALEECKTFFELERRLQESGTSRVGCAFDKVQLVLSHKDGDKAVLPEHWPDITRSRDALFIDLSMPNGIKPKDMDKNSSGKSLQPVTKSSSIQPFFQWPHSEKKAEKTDLSGSPNSPEAANPHFGFITPEAKRSMHCMEQVEKAIVTEALDDWEANTVVERSFTTNEYYESLAESKIDDLRYNFAILLQTPNMFSASRSGRTMHQTIAGDQCSQLSKCATELVDILFETLKLFVDDVDKSSIIRKIWAAMLAMFRLIHEAQRNSSHPTTDGLGRKRAWYVRSSHSVQKGKFVPLPANEQLRASVKTCVPCRRGRSYTDRDNLIEHLRGHLQKDTEAQPSNATGRNNQVAEPNLDDWVRSDVEVRTEETNAAYLAILTKATDQSRMLFKEIKELADGVLNADGKMSDIYTFPHELLKTFHRLVVFYLAVERAVYHTHECLKKQNLKARREDIPFSKVGLEVLERFAESAKASVLAARRELSYMARSQQPQDIMKRLSLGPEYLCSWFLRRLIVKPIENSLTVADLYREYITALQFQVNHRPSKRLLRSINLIQEELAALEKVNAWQIKLVTSYDKVLDDSMYQFEIPSRRAMFPYERQVLAACLDNLSDAQQDYAELIERCGPLSESTKQSAEINEEDHGKAILVFTVVTIIFLPLSFVTSYLGMNTSDIRDMNDTQTLFWEIAIPLTVVTMGTMIFIAYNGEELRGRLTSIYRRAIGKPSTRTTARGISVAQRKRASRYPSESASTLDYRSIADEAEFIAPQPIYNDPFPDWFQPIVSTKTQRHEYLAPPSPVAIRARHVRPSATIPTYERRSKPTRVSTFDDAWDNTYTSYAPARAARHVVPPPPAPRLENSRISAAYLLPETLDYYAIPWDYEPTDRNFIILRQELGNRELDVLYEHTRRLKSKKSENSRHRNNNEEWYADKWDNDWYAPGGAGGGGAPVREYSWVKKKPVKRGRRATSRSGRRGGNEWSYDERERERRPY